MKRRLLSFLMAILMAVGIAPMFACNNGGVDDIVKDKNVLNVKIYRAGFGIDYIEAFEKQFAETFKDEGYAINVTAHDPFLMGEAVYRSVYSDSGIDVFFASSTTAEAGMAGKNYQNSFTDITDCVYKKPAIKFDGTEESMTIEQKLKDTGVTIENNIYNGKYYGLPYAFTNGGLNVNTRALYDVFGYTEMPRTTREMFAMADKIMSKYDEEFIAPFTFSISGNNYLAGAVAPWMAQLMGVEGVRNYFGFLDENGNELRPVWEGDTLVGGAYEVFENPAFEDVFASVYHIVDHVAAADNAASQTFEQAQMQFMRGDAVFYFCGDWVYNEEKVRSEKYLGDIDYIRTPVISKVGYDLFGAGTSYGFDDAKADKTLSTIIKYVDQNLSTEIIEVKAEQELGYALETADVLTVCEKRGYMRSDGSAPQVHVSSKIPAEKLPVAEAFLRFVASDDAGQMFADNAFTTSPWKTDAMLNSPVKFLKSVASFAHNQHNVEVDTSDNGYKLKVGYQAFFAGLGEVWSASFYQDYITKYDEETGALIAGDEVYVNAGKAKAKWMVDHAYDQVSKKLWRASDDYQD